MAEIVRSGTVFNAVACPSELDIDGLKYPAKGLTPDEAVQFDEFYDNVIAPMLISRVTGATVPQDDIAALYQMRKNHAKALLCIVKTEGQLGGSFAIEGKGSQLSMSRTASWHIRRTVAPAAQTPDDSWNHTFADGQNNFLGWGALWANTARTDKEAAVLIFGVLLSAVAPVVEALRFTIGGVTYLPDRLESGVYVATADDLVRIIPVKPKIILPKTEYTAVAYGTAAAANYCVLLGVTVGKAQFLANITPKTTVD